MDTDDVVTFIQMLEPDEAAVHYFSGIHPDASHQPQRIQAYGTLEEMIPKLAQRNSEGYGIFTTANAIREDYTDGFPRRKAEQVERVRCVFADWDNPLREPPANWPLPPSMIVRTSPNKYHIYWLVNDFPLDKFEQAQRGIAKALGTDPSVIDLSREMRVAGFGHTKGEPFPVEILECDPDIRYGADEILGAFPYKSTVTKLNAPWDGTVRDKARLTAAVVDHFYGPARPDGAYNVRCPWESSHTTPSNPTSTIYYPPAEDNVGKGYFKCLHAHCMERYADHYDDWLSNAIAGAIV